MSFSHFDPLRNVKNKVFVHLGWWHPYKFANELLWKVVKSDLLFVTKHLVVEIPSDVLGSSVSLHVPKEQMHAASEADYLGQLLWTSYTGLQKSTKQANANQRMESGSQEKLTTALP